MDPHPVAGDGGEEIQSRMNDPVFIVGGSRTGSEMLKTMLSASPDLDFVDELFLRCPWWLHMDLERLVRRRIGDLRHPGARDKLVELLFSGEPYGWVWGRAREKFDRATLRGALESGPLEMKTIFTAIMEAHAARKGKRGRGAKFPMHYGSTRQLIEWFPDCKLIHTTREPRAVYASQANKYVSSDDPALKQLWMKFQQFVHINIQTSWTARVHRQMADLANYRLVRYEDVVRDPQGELEGLCEFLGVEFVPAMLTPNQYGSSYGQIKGQRGVDPSSLEAWRTRIHPVTAGLVRGFHPSAYRHLGYDH